MRGETNSTQSEVCDNQNFGFLVIRCRHCRFWHKSNRRLKLHSLEKKFRLFFVTDTVGTGGPSGSLQPIHGRMFAQEQIMFEHIQPCQERSTDGPNHPLQNKKFEEIFFHTISVNLLLDEFFYLALAITKYASIPRPNILEANPIKGIRIFV